MSKDQLRSSQVITSFGPGAMLDLPEASVIVGGLENWKYDNSNIPSISEPRLVAKLNKLLDRDNISLRKPPPASNQGYGIQPDITVWRFPEWFIVQHAIVLPNGARKRKLVNLSSLNNMKYKDEDIKMKVDVVPIRFVRACPRGHIGDIDWKAFVHNGKTQCIKQLWVEERGTGGGLQDIWIVCDCKASRDMSQAARISTHSLGNCNGLRPWLGAHSMEGCGHPNKFLIRSASNAYFSQQMSVISIPDTQRPIDNVVRALWDNFLSDVETMDELIKIRTKPAVRDGLDGLSDDDVLESIKRVRDGVPDFEDRSIKEVEFEALSESEDELGEDKPDGDFYARALDKSIWDANWMDSIERVVLVHRLREVIAQVGFTRFEADSPDIEGELSLDVQRAPLAINTEWLPATENRGEGIFILFKPDVVNQWHARYKTIQREIKLGEGFKQWKAEKHSERKFPGLPYYFLHTLSHMLMTVISLDCGYPASSLRERIYAMQDRYGIMIYTGSTDSQGTLGGLVQAGREIKKYMLLAIESGKLCSNDPICAHHDPAHGDLRELWGSACHGCLLVSETSCEQANSYLDRALVVETIESIGAEFFTGI